MDDAQYMRRALELARLAEGSVSPRPPVGAVVVAPDGTIVGEGYTRPKPGPHAEPDALDRAGDHARGATVYVTLEPCNTRKSKPASGADYLIDAAVARVVACVNDPCPDVDGRGFAMLRRAGVSVDVGLERAAAARLIEPFAKWIATGLPFVTLKTAMSLDGKVAAPDGTSQWITGEEARAEVHDLRRRVDAVVVGAGTIEADDPQLTFRTPGTEGAQPLRVVIDSSGRTRPSARVFNDDAPSLILTTEDAEWQSRDVTRLPRGEGGVDLTAAIQELGRRGVCHVLVEPGPILGASFAATRLVDRFIFYVAPKIIGGDAPGVFASGVKTLADAWQL